LNGVKVSAFKLSSIMLGTHTLNKCHVGKVCELVFPRTSYFGLSAYRNT
jgi:hypothetical protein